MDEQRIEGKAEFEIDLKRLIGAVWHRAWVVALSSFLCALIALLWAYYMITPQYQSSAMFYVNNKNVENSPGISSGDLTTSRNLVESYLVILKTRESLNDLAEYAGVNRSVNHLRGMISGSGVNETEIFQVSVVSTDPEEAEMIANAVIQTLPNRLSRIIDGTSVKAVETVASEARKCAPSLTNNTILGFALGFLLSVGLIILGELLDVSVRNEEDIAQNCQHPVLTAVPDMQAPTKGGYYYGYGSKKSGKKVKGSTHNRQNALIGRDISFAAAEAYKMLRTKLQFSFVDAGDCRVIGVSSALTGEGKSLTSVNLAYTLSQLDKKVLLIDCDMRRPSLAAKLPIQRLPGLSSYLSGQSQMDTLFQNCALKGEEDAFQVVSSGRNPPNPMELLSSQRMADLLQALRKMYDYVILDLPPVGEVGDALAVAKQTDGMLLVVRQNYCNRGALADAVAQFEFMNAKILGIIFNCTAEQTGSYSKRYGKKYYKSYHRRYYKSYEGNYSSAMKLAENDKKVQ